MRNEIDQDAVEQIDMIGLEIRRPLQEQFSDLERYVREALGIALPDNLIEPGDQRRGDGHETHSNPAGQRVFRQFRQAW